MTTPNLTLWVPRLEASLEDRAIGGLLLPFNEAGHTNLGRLTASAATQLDAAPNAVLNIEHDRTRPVGRSVSITRDTAGLRASFHVVSTRDGDDALVLASEGLRAGLSVELEPVVTRDGQIISGTVTGAALVVQPAFPSARLNAAELEPVPDLGGTPDLPAVVLDGTELEGVTAVEVTPEQITIATQAPPTPEQNAGALPASAHREEPTMTASAVAPATPAAPPAPAQVHTPALVAAAQPPATPEPMTVDRLFAALVEYNTTRMEAALSDIVPANTPGVGMQQPQYVGELWDGVEYERKFLNAFKHAELTSYNVKGWKWNNKPVVAKYTGNKTDVSSGTISTTEVNGVLQRFAGAHDIDRIYTDFGDSEFWQAYFAAMAESYAMQTDLYVRDIVREIPTAANTGRQHLLTGAAPANVPYGLWLIVEGCAKILNDLNTLPTHAYITVDYWKPILYTPVTQVLTYLNAALGLKDGTLEGQGGGFRIIPVPVGSLTATQTATFTGKVLVAHKDALSVRELGGGAPIRVNAIDVAKGGVDEGVFGYVGTLVEDARGFALYDAPAAT